MSDEEVVIRQVYLRVCSCPFRRQVRYVCNINENCWVSEGESLPGVLEGVPVDEVEVEVLDTVEVLVLEEVLLDEVEVEVLETVEVLDTVLEVEAGRHWE